MSMLGKTTLRSDESLSTTDASESTSDEPFPPLRAVGLKSPDKSVFSSSSLKLDDSAIAQILATFTSPNGATSASAPISEETEELELISSQAQGEPNDDTKKSIPSQVAMDKFETSNSKCVSEATLAAQVAAPSSGAYFDERNKEKASAPCDF